jgi:hypothetical protein
VTFHQSSDVTVLGVANKIALRMAGSGAVFDFHGPFPDGDSIGDLTAAVSTITGVPPDLIGLGPQYFKFSLGKGFTMI